jgi:hypothetical protein
MSNNIIQRLVDNNYPYDPIRNIYSLEKYLKNGNYYNVIYGFNCYDGQIYNTHKNVLIDFEEPNFFFMSNEAINHRIAHVKQLHKKITLCPYAARLLNTTTTLNNVTSCFFMVDNDYLVDTLGLPNYDKPNDVIYIGNNVSGITAGFKQFNPPNLSIPTYLDKIQTLYNTKISICHNVLFLKNHFHIYSNAIQYFPELANDKLEIPQLKSRIFESGFSKCIPLVYFDQSKIVEQFFEPDVDFIYFYSIADLQMLVDKILNNYDSYKFIAENIYKKCNDKYKISDFVNTYIL